MPELRREMPPVPVRVARLPHDHRGFPVPWFVQWFKDGKPCATGEGQPDFRVINTSKMVTAMRSRRCWICGDHLGQYKAFVIGPMCALNRIISEPPSHLDCARFAAVACPFLSQPRMKRNLKNVPGGTVDAAGVHIDRNPGAVCVWVCRDFKLFRPSAKSDGVLFSLGDPVRMEWYAKGRTATFNEIMNSIDTGLPELMKMAIRDGEKAVDLLNHRYSNLVASLLLPTGSAQQGELR